MWTELEEGVQLFTDCWNAPIERVAIENPIMHRHARERMPLNLPRPHIVQPWWFGDPFFKGTGIYLRDLPPLIATNRLTPPAPGTNEHKEWSRVHRSSGWGKKAVDRWRERARFFPGIADAMAAQWGGDVIGYVTQSQYDLFA